MFNNKLEHHEFELLKQYLFENEVANPKNKPTISELYEYVFGNKFEVKPIHYIATKKIKNVPSDNSTSSKIKEKISHEEIQNRINDKMQTKINDFKTSLGESVLSNPNFRKLLHQTNPSLEMHLFSNVSEQLEGALSLDYAFPSDDAIGMKFVEQNTTYGYFSENTDKYTIAMKQFIILFKGCKLVADYIEKNNDADNLVSALHAYKILVLFGAEKNLKNPFVTLETYLKNHQGYVQPNPIHDCLITALPKNTNHEIHDLTGWRKLISQYGPKAIEYFQSASAIEKHLDNSAPANLNEASKAASKITYKNYQVYPALAKLCMQYHINESIFDGCLEIEKSRKKYDNLPAIDIDGAEVAEEYTGYHLIKLPINDARAYVLGHITNCCQSMGGESEACVIDGITRENNGFYVLLKNKNLKTNQSSPRLENGQINYKDYAIVGQGYAWLSTLGNLTFDSWENLRPNEEWSCGLSRLSDEPKSSSIIKDTPGINASNNLLILFKDHFFYIDWKEKQLVEISVLDENSSLQLMLLFAHVGLNEYRQVVNPNAIPFIPTEQEDTTAVTMLTKFNERKVNDSGASQDDTIAASMLTRFSERVTRDKDSEIVRVTIGRGGKTPALFRLKEELTNPEKIGVGHQYGDSKYQSIVFLNKEKQEGIISSLITSIQTSYFDTLLTDSLIAYMQEIDIVSKKQTDEMNELLSDVRYETIWPSISHELKDKNSPLSQIFINNGVWEVLLALHKGNSFNKEMVDNLADSVATYKLMLKLSSNKWNPWNADEFTNKKLIPLLLHVVNAINTLNEAHLLSTDNYNALLENMNYCEYFNKGFQQLSNAGFLTDALCKLVIKAKGAAQSIGNINGLTKEQITTYLGNPKYFSSLNLAFTQFRMNALFTEENVNAVLFAGGTYALVILETLKHLQTAELLNTDTFDIFMNWMKAQEPTNKNLYSKGSDFNDILKFLNIKKIVTQDNFISILENTAHAKDIKLAAAYIFTNDNLKVLLANLDKIKSIGSILSILAYCKLLTPDSCTVTLSKVDNIEELNLAIALLEKADSKLFTQTNFEWLLSRDSMAKATTLTKLYVALKEYLNTCDTPHAVKNIGFFENNANPSYLKLLNYLKGAEVDFEKKDDEALSNLPPTIENLYLDLIKFGYPMPEQLQDRTFYIRQ